jgi:curved DNA-binding protein CbpA
VTCLPVLPFISIRLIQRIVCDRYGLALAVMQSPSRIRANAHPRQLAMRLSREFTGKSLPTIGRYFGGRDHTTVIHAIGAVERRNLKSQDARDAYLELKAALEMIAPRPTEVNMPDLYAELGLQPGASSEEIKAAHRRSVREHHPDLGGDKAKFQAIQLAYDTLRDGERRKRYDETGETASAARPDPAVEMLGMIIENMIAQMLEDGAAVETIDMRQALLDAVDGKVAEITREVQKAERQIAKARQLAERWKRKRKAKGPDLIGDTVRRRERDLREGLTRAGEALEAWGRAAKLLDDYEYKVDAAPAWAGRGPGFGMHFVRLDFSA